MGKRHTAGSQSLGCFLDGASREDAYFKLGFDFLACETGHRSDLRLNKIVFQILYSHEFLCILTNWRAKKMLCRLILGWQFASWGLTVLPDKSCVCAMPVQCSTTQGVLRIVNKDKDRRTPTCVMQYVGLIFQTCYCLLSSAREILQVPKPACKLSWRLICSMFILGTYWLRNEEISSR